MFCLLVKAVSRAFHLLFNCFLIGLLGSSQRCKILIGTHLESLTIKHEHTQLKLFTSGHKHKHRNLSGDRKPIQTGKLNCKDVGSTSLVLSFILLCKKKKGHSYVTVRVYMWKKRLAPLLHLKCFRSPNKHVKTKRSL